MLSSSLLDKVLKTFDLLGSIPIILMYSLVRCSTVRTTQLVYGWFYNTPSVEPNYSLKANRINLDRPGMTQF